jgi:glycosyltransferase involved in cell wall biosynthesis
MASLRILMMGAILTQNGGIASVEKLMLSYAPQQIEIQHIPSHDEGSAVHRIGIFVRCLLMLCWQLLSQPFDLVYIHISDGGSIARKVIIASIALLFQKPIVIHTHGAEFPKSYEKIPNIIKRYIKWIFQQSKLFITLSHSWRDFYITNCHLNPSQVVVLPNPTEIPRTIPNRDRKDDTVYLCFCGRIGHRKGAFDLINAFANLPDRYLDRTQLIMAGDGDIELAKQSIDKLNLTNKITLTGWIDSGTREKLLAQSDIFILPSYHEGLPMAILEAMSWGLPIISTSVGGIPELIVNDKNGLLIEPGNSEKLVNVMQTIIEDRDLRLRLGQQARESVLDFDIVNYWSNLGGKLNKILCF